MNPQDPLTTYNPQNTAGNDLPVTQPGEGISFEIKRHPIGIIGAYATSSLVIVVTAILVFGALPAITNNNVITTLGGIFLVLLVIICSIYGFIFTKIYWGNTWTVSSDSLTQITQTNLMSRHSSRLLLENLENVTVEQKGPLAGLFHYGLLRLETVGEDDNYVFPYCPNPNFYAQQILAARGVVQPHQAPEHEHPLIERLPPLPQTPDAPGMPDQPPTPDA